MLEADADILCLSGNRGCRSGPCSEGSAIFRERHLGVEHVEGQIACANPAIGRIRHPFAFGGVGPAARAAANVVSRGDRPAVALGQKAGACWIVTFNPANDEHQGPMVFAADRQIRTSCRLAEPMPCAEVMHQRPLLCHGLEQRRGEKDCGQQKSWSGREWHENLVDVRTSTAALDET